MIKATNQPHPPPPPTVILPLSLSRYEVRTDLSLLGTQLEDLIEQFNTPPSVTDEVQTGASESLDSFDVLSDETVGDDSMLMIELGKLQEVVEPEPAHVELARINSAVERAQRARYVWVGFGRPGDIQRCFQFTLLVERIFRIKATLFGK